MNNTFLKNTVLTLTLGLLSNTSIATNDAYDNELSDLKRSTTVQQVHPQYAKDKIEELEKMVFSGEPLLNIGSYLGRQETGRLQQVSKSINGFFKQEQEGLQLWKGYAHQLQLKIADDIKVEDLISQIRDYYDPGINILVDLNDRRYVDMSCFDFGESIITRFSYDSRNRNRKTIHVLKTDGRIESIAIFDDGYVRMAKAVSADSKVIAGWTWNGNIGSRKTATIWSEERIVSLNDYPFKQSQNHFDLITAMSSDGADFIAQSKEGKTYKVHIPRYDLWKMK